MGEIADSILDGDFCQVCGEYLGEGDGFPVTCPACLSDEDYSNDWENYESQFDK